MLAFAAAKPPRNAAHTAPLLVFCPWPWTSVSSPDLGDIRRFNESFHRLFGQPPTALRRTRTSCAEARLNRKHRDHRSPTLSCARRLARDDCICGRACACRHRENQRRSLHAHAHVRWPDRQHRGRPPSRRVLPLRANQDGIQRALRTIPCGETCTYSALARQIGQPSAARAIGLANGKNPLGVIVPCHRVIGANGTLTGYGGGIARKRWLLAHERSAASDAQIALFDD